MTNVNLKLRIVDQVKQFLLGQVQPRRALHHPAHPEDDHDDLDQDHDDGDGHNDHDQDHDDGDHYVAHYHPTPTWPSPPSALPNAPWNRDIAAFRKREPLQVNFSFEVFENVNHFRQF